MSCAGLFDAEWLAWPAGRPTQLPARMRCTSAAAKLYLRSVAIKLLISFWWGSQDLHACWVEVVSWVLARCRMWALQLLKACRQLRSRMG